MQSATVLQCITYWWCAGRNGVMQCVASVAVCCSLLQCRSALQCISECCRMLQCMSEWWCDDRGVIMVSIVWGGPKLMSLRLLVNSSVDVEKISFVPVRHGWVPRWSLYQRFLVKLPLLYQVVWGDKCEQIMWCWKKGHPIPGDDVSNGMLFGNICFCQAVIRLDTTTAVWLAYLEYTFRFVRALLLLIPQLCLQLRLKRLTNSKA